MLKKFIFLIISAFILIDNSGAAIADSAFDNQFASVQSQINSMSGLVQSQSNALNNTLSGNEVDNSNLYASQPLPTNTSKSKVKLNLVTKLPTLPSLKVPANVSVGSNFASPCLAAYFNSLGGKSSNVKGCAGCSLAGQNSSNLLSSALDPTINSVIPEPSSNIVNPAIWNSLTDFQRNVIIKENPSVKLALDKGANTQNSITNCLNQPTLTNSSELNAMNFLSQK